MHIIIVGAGKVGQTLINNFTLEKHDIVVVDADFATVDKVVNHHDVKGIVRGGLEPKVLIPAGAEPAAFLTACTPHDEMNLLCCVLAKKIGVNCTIARVRDPAYFREMESIRADLGLDYAFNPALATAHEIARVLKMPLASRVENFTGSKARMAELGIVSTNPLMGKTPTKIAQA